jgi:hypothetical protein
MAPVQLKPSEIEAAPEGVKKVTVNLPENLIEMLKRLADSRHTTMTEVLKSAIRTEGFIDQTTKGGSQVLVKAPDNTMREIIFR